MTNLRKEAKGRPCMIREPGICNADPATTVLCHLNGGGMAMKHDDKHGAWGCCNCHSWVDGGYIKTGHTKEYMENAHLWGVIRTQQVLIREGKL
ncbi:MAG: nuclease domain-containing protein [Candidatus Thiodiazotropha endolucinida]